VKDICAAASRLPWIKLKSLWNESLALFGVCESEGLRNFVAYATQFRAQTQAAITSPMPEVPTRFAFASFALSMSPVR